MTEEERDPEANQYCPKLKATLKREAEVLEMKERREYQEFLNREARFKYLHEKYGKSS